MDLAKQLQQIRLARHLSTQEAADVLFGMSRRTYEGLEQGRNSKEWDMRCILYVFEREAPHRPASHAPSPGRPSVQRKPTAKPAAKKQRKPKVQL